MIYARKSCAGSCHLLSLHLLRFFFASPQSAMSSLCHYGDRAVNGCVDHCRDTCLMNPQGQTQPVVISYLPPFFPFFVGGGARQKNKYVTERRCLCKSHFTCVLGPATLSSGGTQPRDCRKSDSADINMTDFLCNDNAIEHTVL